MLLHSPECKMSPRWPPKIVHLLRKNILPLTAYLVHKAFYSPLPVTVSIFTVSAFIFLTFTANTPQHIFISSSTTLHIQHFLKPFTVTSGETLCHVLVIHTDWIIHSYFLVYKLLEPKNNYSVKNFKGMCSRFLCCVCGLISLVHGSFYGF